MRQITYSMEFKGTATPAGEEPGVLKATTSATSCSLVTIVGPDGVTGTFHPAEGDVAYFESEVRSTGKDMFLESGAITFGDGGHSLRFSTVGQGHMGPSGQGKQLAGAVIWKVEGGEGQFQDATGLITSNFLVSESGEVMDCQFGVIYVK